MFRDNPDRELVTEGPVTVLRYKELPHEVEPPDSAGTVWRYMDLPKFLSILEFGGLHFSRADALGDPFEGSTTVGNLDRLAADMEGALGDWPEEEKRRFLDEGVRPGNLRKMTYISCWSLSQSESVALWSLYTHSENGVAIRSTCGGLLSSDHHEGRRITLCKVKYIHYPKATFFDANGLNFFCHKRLGYAHEQEVRAMIIYKDVDAVKAKGWEAQPPGLLVSYALEKLIQDVHVHPGAPLWFRDLVSSITRRAGLSILAKQSSLDEEPLI